MALVGTNSPFAHWLKNSIAQNAGLFIERVVLGPVVLQWRQCKLPEFSRFFFSFFPVRGYLKLRWERAVFCFCLLVCFLSQINSWNSYNSSTYHYTNKLRKKGNVIRDPRSTFLRVLWRKRPFLRGWGWGGCMEPSINLSPSPPFPSPAQTSKPDVVHRHQAVTTMENKLPLSFPLFTAFIDCGDVQAAYRTSCDDIICTEKS